MQRRLLLVGLATYVSIAAPAHSEGLHDAFEAAWNRQPASRATSYREEELAAKRNAASALIPESPSLNLGYRTDQPNQNTGIRELEGVLSLPMWVPAARDAAQSLAQAETDQFSSSLRAQRWRLAGELRESYWQARLTATELDVAQRKVDESVALAVDVERRVKAGDLARSDLNQARAAEQLARVALADARARSFRAAQAFFALTGMKVLPIVVEAPTARPREVDGHPQLDANERVAITARARLGQATAATRDAPEIEIGMRRERGAFGEPYANSVIVGIKWPFATEARNQPRITAANAELIEAQAASQLERQKLGAEIDAAQVELEQAHAIEQLAAERFRLAADTQALLAKAFVLGELDLPARLRAENERFDAELALTRSRVEVGRAISRYNQAIGVLP